MGTKYTSQSATGYNASPPPDDGTTVAANKITWSGTKTKLADPIYNWISSVNSALVTALDVSASTTSVNYTTAATDHQKPIYVTGTTTISLGDATTMGTGYQVPIINTGTALVTVGVITATDTLNGTANGTITLPPYSSGLFETTSGANGYVMVLGKGDDKQTANIASAATVNLDASTPFGNYAHITGTTTITAITLQKGSEFKCVFDGILTLTNSASLIIQGGANITTAAGDIAVFRGEASGVVRVLSYVRESALPALSGANSDITSMSAVTSLSTAAGVSVHGSNTNDSAAAGYVGEFVSSSVAVGSAIALTNATNANVTSISLTAGDWDVWAVLGLTGNAATTIQYIQTSISNTSATMDTTIGRYSATVPVSTILSTSSQSHFQNTGTRISLASTTTIYLVTQVGFSVNTCSAFGILQARRVR